MTFVRNFDTKHTDDYSLAAQCVYLLGAWGGSVTSYSSPAQFLKHPGSNRAAISQLLCLYECTGQYYVERYMQYNRTMCRVYPIAIV